MMSMIFDMNTKTSTKLLNKVDISIKYPCVLVLIPSFCPIRTLNEKYVYWCQKLESTHAIIVGRCWESHLDKHKDIGYGWGWGV